MASRRWSSALAVETLVGHSPARRWPVTLVLGSTTDEETVVYYFEAGRLRALRIDLQLSA
jgi:hypothetical protein